MGKPRKQLARAVLAGTTALAVTTPALFIGMSPAQADDIDEAISNIETKGNYQIGSVLELSADWSVPDYSDPGDTFTLPLPPELTARGTTFPLNNTEGQKVADAVVTESGVTVTLSDYVADNPLNIGGKLNFFASINQTATPGTPITISWGGTTESITPVASTGPGTVTEPRKVGGYHARTDSTQWTIQVPGEAQDVVITDTPQGHQLACENLVVQYAPQNSSTWSYADPASFDQTCDPVAGFTVNIDSIPANTVYRVVINVDHSQPMATNAAGNLTNNWTVTSSAGDFGGTQTTPIRGSGGTGSGNGDASLGDKVWFDDNQNGLQDAGEAGVPNVTAILLDANGSEVSRATTDANGNYLFPRLTPNAMYSVVFEGIPEGYGFTVRDAGDEAFDSDANVTTGATDQVILQGNNLHLRTLDAGIILLPQEEIRGSIGDKVWTDSNRDGIQDEGESPVPGVTVTLTDSEGNQVGQVTTNENGNYLFPDLELGDYNVTFSDLPEGFEFTQQDAGGDDTTDSDANPEDGRTVTVTLTEENPDNMTIDAGIVETPEILGSIGNYVWYDSNNDGIQDEGETPASGVTVTLKDSEGNDVATTTTGEDGQYLFSDLPLGEYSVVFTDIPEGHSITQQDAGEDDALDSDANAEGATTTVVLTEENPDNMTLDAGLVTNPVEILGSIGDRVWYDANDNGIQDEGEESAEGITVTLRDAEGNEVATATTDAEGKYLFPELPLAGYSVVFSDIPEGYSLAKQDQGDDDAADSDAGTDGSTAIVVLTEENPDVMTIDAGLVQNPVEEVLGSIGDRVWYDTNRNGIQDEGEESAQGVTVTLKDAEGNDVSTTTTDAEGNYLFSDLVLADYSVVFSDLPEGFGLTQQDAGENDEADSDANEDGATTVVSLTEENPDNMTLDAGLVEIEQEVVLGSIGDKVWDDTNKNGIQDEGEAPVSDVTVTLLDSEGNEVATTVTDENGNYLFPDLDLGDYTVVFSNLPEGFEFTQQDAGDDDATDSDANAEDGRTVTITLTEETPDVMTVDAGIFKTPEEEPTTPPTEEPTPPGEEPTDDPSDPVEENPAPPTDDPSDPVVPGDDEPEVQEPKPGEPDTDAPAPADDPADPSINTGGNPTQNNTAAGLIAGITAIIAGGMIALRKKISNN